MKGSGIVMNEEEEKCEGERSVVKRLELTNLLGQRLDLRGCGRGVEGGRGRSESAPCPALIPDPQSIVDLSGGTDGKH